MNASVFGEWGARLKNQLVLQMGPLNNLHIIAGLVACSRVFLNCCVASYTQKCSDYFNTSTVNAKRLRV